MSEIDAVLYEYVKFIHVIYGSFSVSGFNRFMHFLSTYANSWIKIAARRTLFDPVWFPVGIRRWVGPGMALTTIGEVPQWGGVADWSSCRTVEAVLRGRPAAPSEGNHRCGSGATHRRPDECPANLGSSATRLRSTAERIWTAWVGRRQRGGG